MVHCRHSLFKKLLCNNYELNSSRALYWWQITALKWILWFYFYTRTTVSLFVCLRVWIKVQVLLWRSCNVLIHYRISIKSAQSQPSWCRSETVLNSSSQWGGGAHWLQWNPLEQQNRRQCAFFSTAPHLVWLILGNCEQHVVFWLTVSCDGWWTWQCHSQADLWPCGYNPPPPLFFKRPKE